MTYQFTVYTSDRKIVQGTLEAASESMAEEALYQSGHRRILSLKEAQPGSSLGRLLQQALCGVKTQDVVDFSRQLAFLIESGIPILTALQLLEEQVSRASLRKVITGLVEELRGGSSFSQALRKYPHVFSSTYRQVMRASEHAGNLEIGLRQLAGHMERQLATKKKIKRAMMYPVIVLMMGIGVIGVLTTVALPPLVELLTSFDVELPLMTRLLMGGSAFVSTYKFYLLGGIFISVISVVAYMRRPAGKLAKDKLMLKSPVLGSVTLEHNIAQFCRTTSMLLKAGLLLPQIMNILGQTLGNRIICQRLTELREKLIQGQSLSQAMVAVGLFPRVLVEMVVVAEKTGNLESALATLAAFYEERVSQKINSLVSAIEPTLTIMIGLMVGFIALSIITPLYSIMGSIG